ncbi:acyl-coenzyme A synthetase ACSM2B, mitochondrial-like [Belonocnema kinseyi]|uniref:acyl-coenzyme A synthetase ACSM2B, mitochondrial-like n=1 Tax=Belonocnema kinseyi TaxID=2817044 RepID=UPI00143CE2AB|nr:acyl-coenzyme A synthetase ACSM2B, mitochondrial-like [Belonocnema kinseyi]
MPITSIEAQKRGRGSDSLTVMVTDTSYPDSLHTTEQFEIFREVTWRVETRPYKGIELRKIDYETGKTSKHKKLAEESIRCAIWLKKQGIESGDVVAICSENNIASWAPVCAVFYLGANLNPWYYDWPSDTFRYLLNLTKPKIVFANEKMGRLLNKIIEEKNIDMKIVIFGKVDGLLPFDDIINDQSPDEVEQFECRSANPHDDCVVLFTSGSTGGLPKGVQHTYEGIFYICYTFNTSFSKIEGMASMCPSPMY